MLNVRVDAVLFTITLHRRVDKNRLNGRKLPHEFPDLGELGRLD